LVTDVANQLRMLFMVQGRVNFKYLLLLCTVKFYKLLYFKSGLLHDILVIYDF